MEDQHYVTQPLTEVKVNFINVYLLRAVGYAHESDEKSDTRSELSVLLFGFKKQF